MRLTRILLFNIVFSVCSIATQAIDSNESIILPVHRVRPFKKRPIVVAVIDTGISESLFSSSYLCKMGHKDFTGTSLNDTMGHGTHISGLIDQYAKHIFLSEETDIAALLSKEVEYCQVILKIYDIKPKNTNILKNELDALRYAISIKVDVINISGGGTDSSPEEIALTKKALDLGIKIVAAAGNNHSDITLPNNHYYPACNDPRILVVGNIDSDNKRVPSSNYGDTVTSWEIGINVLSLTDATHLAMMTGSSQACAIKSGKLVHEMLSKQQH